MKAGPGFRRKPVGWMDVKNVVAAGPREESGKMVGRGGKHLQCYG